MKVLVTGASGFIGNHVINALLAEGVEIVATSVCPEKAAKQAWYQQVIYRPYKIGTPPPASNLYEYFLQPDKLVHLAWSGLPNYRQLSHVEQNLMPHYHFIKALVTNGLTDVTVAGTCLEYGLQAGALAETLPTQPVTAYGIAKDALRKFLQLLQTEQPFFLKWLRLFYTYGEGQNEKSLFSQLLTAIEQQVTVFNMSGGEQLRDYTPAGTLARHIAALGLLNYEDGVINCCSGTPIAVRTLVERFVHQQSASLALNLGHYSYPTYEPMAFWGDNTKMNSLLNISN